MESHALKVRAGLAAGAIAVAVGSPAGAQNGRLPESYVRVAAWQARPAARPPGEFTAAAGVDVAEDGTVFVVDKAEGTVHVLTADGRGLRLIGSPGHEVGQLASPSDVDVAAGRVYVTDTGNRRVQVFDASGGFLAEWRDLGRPWGVAVGADRVYVSDAEAPRITVFDLAGVALSTWGPGAGEDVSLPLATPRGMAIDGDGDVYIADPGRPTGPLVEVTDRGGLKRTLGPSSDEPGSRPVDVALAGGQPHTVSAEEIVAYRQILFTTVATRLAAVNGGKGIAAGPGNGMVATVQDGWAIASGVRFFRDRGSMRQSEMWGDLPVALGALRGPRRVAAADDGGAYLADAWPRVQRWGPGGLPVGQFRADGVVDIARAPGGGVYLIEGARVSRLATDGGRVWTWREWRPGSWFAAGAALADGRLVVADIGRGRLLVFGAADGEPGPAAEAPLSGIVVDAAADGDRVLVADRSVQALRVVDLAGAELGRWPFPGRVTRVAAAGNGRGWFVLTADGWARKYAVDGSLRAAWDGAPEGAPVDLDVNTSGGVLVADGRGDRVFVYAPRAQASDVVPPEPGDRCDLVPEKTAAPPRVAVGAPVTVTLSLVGDCPAESIDLDVVLVIDKSGSMDGPKIEAARAAAVAFTAELDFRRVQAGVVLFDSGAALQQPLTNSAELLVRAAAAAQPGGGTNIAEGLRVARTELQGTRARAGVAKAVVLMTDGLPDDADAARREAQATRSAGMAVFTVGLGGDVDGGLLTDIAGAPDRYFQAPTETELGAIFARIARRLVAGALLRAIEIVDEVPRNMAYVAGSARPPATWDGARLRWSLADVPPAGFQLTYQVQPQQSGTWPTNVRADGDYVDGVGFAGKVAFPVPRVTVFGDRVAYLPILFKSACPEQRSDVILVIDTSSSMDGTTAPGGETKLDAARHAAQAFIGLLTLPSDRAAVVGFNDAATVVQTLTGDRGALERSLARLPRAAGTRIDLGLAAALAELTGPRRRTTSLPVVVLLTDGRPSGGTERDVARQVEALGSAGAFIFTIGLGADADGGLLIAIAGSAARYSYAPDQRALATIYQTIAWSLPCRVGE